jgi:hypothetical protein
MSSMPRRWSGAFAAATALSLLVVAGASDGAQDPQAAASSSAVTRSATVGHGLLSPYRALLSARGDLLYVATGGGEAYPEGYLHALDAITLAEAREPIEVGRNVSDMLALQGHLLLASRGEGTLTLVDPVLWRVLDRIELGFSPIALAALPGGVAVVGSIDSTDLVAVAEVNGKLVIRRRAQAVDIANDLTATQDGSTVYVASPNAGIVSYDANTLSLQRVTPVPNRDLGKGIIVWHGYVVSVGQDGYIYFVDRTTNGVTTVDVAPDLGLTRAGLPARAIDCTQVIDLGDDRLAVITDRQQSLVYQVGPSGLSTTLIGLMPAGAFGTFDALRDRLNITVPLANAIVGVALTQTTAHSRELAAQRTVLGVGIAAAQLLGGESPAVAALDSLGAVHILGQSAADDRLVVPPAGAGWVAPFVASPDGTFGLIEVAGGRSSALVLLDREGQKTAEYPVTLPSIYSFAFGDTELAVVSRLSHELLFIDKLTGKSESIVLRHDRPRLAVYAGGDDWLVFHDTTPDIGVTHVHNHVESGFTPMHDWVVGALRVAKEAVIAASFDGTMSIVSADGTVSAARHSAALRGVTDLEYGDGYNVWITSSDLGAAFEVDTGLLTPGASYSAYGLMALGLLQGTTSYGSATTRVLAIAPNY